MQNIPLQDYRDLSQREFYEKYQAEDFKQLLPTLDRKAQEKLDKENLSPRAGISIGFLVQENNLKPQVFFIASHDAHKRGLRFSLNGTADKSDASFHDCRLREFSEEMYHFPFIEKVIKRLPTADSDAYLYSTTNKTNLERLTKGESLYYSEQALYINRSKTYTLNTLNQTLINPLNAAMQEYSCITNDNNGNNMFAAFKFAKFENTDQINRLKKAVKQLLCWDPDFHNPFTEIDKIRLKEIEFRLEQYNINNTEKKTQLVKLMEASVMKYSEAYGVELLSTDDIKDRLSMSEKESGIFSPNYETLKSVTNTPSEGLSLFDQLCENAISTAQARKQIRFGFSGDAAKTEPQGAMQLN